MKKLTKYALLFTSVAVIAGCSSSDKSDNKKTEPAAFEVEKQQVQTIKLKDGNNQLIANAQLVLQKKVQSSSIQSASYNAFADAPIDCSALEGISATTDDKGVAQLPQDVASGSYTVSICKGDVAISFDLEVGADNAQTGVDMIAPVVVDDNGDLVELPTGTIAVSVSGIVYDIDGPVANVQLSISGGEITNGAIATVITDEEGQYSITLQLKETTAKALLAAKVNVLSEQYAALSQDFQKVTGSIVITGLNIFLTEKKSAVSAVYQENFESLVTDGVCGSWTGEDSMWHEHTAGLNIVNNAIAAGRVHLAPDDLSQGKIPNPISGQKSCWYGKASAADSTDSAIGNFLGEESDSDYQPQVVEQSEGNPEANGGTSVSSNKGYIVSPVIDLSNESAPLALSFRTWWEIESVNPNDNGFDLMSIEYTLDDGVTWITHARLNPLSDPASGSDGDRAPTPYTNMGYNIAPNWVYQEAIPVDILAGKLVKLRFGFDTDDEQFNGFRGWLVDDVLIENRQGTFPLWESSCGEEGGSDGEDVQAYLVEESEENPSEGDDENCGPSGPQ